MFDASLRLHDYQQASWMADTARRRWPDAIDVVAMQCTLALRSGALPEAFALLERFEAKLKDYPSNMPRAATELAKEWRLDRALRRLEAMMIVADESHTLLLSGTGDVISPTDGVVAIGSGGNYALAAARSLVKHSQLSAAEIAKESMQVASSIDIYTNDSIIVETLSVDR